ncbi:hypothetical protein T8K17_15690 [Thalassobaculum sp. OXR-137]|uniref:hypothetical protein n=1 Tax=Thalassobaculum sp. OXR-137 TaxID=3100173 RepID=UPI002AC97828|nr:hypothetical protein [Thalassobaculum sp. OXR-137]WPZ32682.1 hypothetical protein T8K17_15690 [Thalassobaculum sp. OXR-137]
MDYFWPPRLTFATIVLIYFLVCALVGLYGRDRLIGFWGSFVAAYIFSPFFIFIFLLLTRRR